MQIQPKKRPKLSFTNTTRLTEQHHREGVKIHNILKQYSATGILSHVNQKTPIYGDFVNVPSYHEAQNIITKARTIFEEVPALLRKQFDNDPGLYLEYIQNPENAEEMKKLGIDTSHFSQLETPIEDKNPQVHLEADILQKTREDALKSLETASQAELDAFLQSREKNSSPTGE